MIQKCQVYLFDDVPLEVIVINKKGQVLLKQYFQWAGDDLIKTDPPDGQIDSPHDERETNP